MANQQNISIGIDLGTTNSSVAINNNGNIEIIKRAGGVEYTPSVFGFNRDENKVVGQKAYESFYRSADVKNYKPEVKRLMGSSEKFHFERVNIDMGPEEISAEILQSLKEDILRKYPNFNTVAAVITVPAAFSVLQSEATKRAGNLAGFKHVVLLQEPIAAAAAYGSTNIKNENWLIYDFGGGTFDVALIASKDRALSVLGHNGDNFLGGKNFDLEIVDKIIVPKILEKFSVKNFNRNNEKYISAFSRLKFSAETAKIELSEYNKTSIVVENVGKDDEDKEIFLSINFTRKEFENLIKPMVDRTIELSRKTLKDAGIKSGSVAKVILVGGPTQIPYIRERIENDLKITADASVDPLTVVARGACVFGIGQKIPKEFQENDGKKLREGTLSIDLNYDSVTSDTEATIAGIIEDLKDAKDEYYVQIQSDSGFYNGSKKKLKGGKFFDTVSVEPNKSNVYWIYLFDKEGNSVPVDQDSFTITQGQTISGIPLSHSVKIVVVQKDYTRNVAFNICDLVFDKGSILPIKKTLYVYKTSRKLKKGEENDLDIIVVEGESDMPDRNGFLCKVGIPGKDLPHDLPEGTPVEITVVMNESQEVFVTAHIPLIDFTVNARSTFHNETIDLKNIEQDLEIQKERAKVVSENLSPDERKTIDNDIQSAQTSVNNSSIDEDEKMKANKQIKDIKIALDKIEKEKEMPQLVKEFKDGIQDTQSIINDYADEKDKDINNDQLNKLIKEGEKAIADNDKSLLIRTNEQINELRSKAVYSNPATWIHQFKKITDSKPDFTNEKEAKYYIEKGKRAIELGDVDEIKRCVRNLSLLLPSDVQEKIKDNLSGITR
ncbi:MAG: Hsp70 family protein [Patescibacteria group bacterium]|nr:Hsp70 family protein [Patescibacteria group bacterium]MDD5163993.1 Hsp70 family protein [Patescibacteria group bacterium]MDD5534923.1 Hsp70 family protein [Patescibacteria group bacterium]